MANLFHPSFGSRPERIVGRDDVIAQFVRGLEREPGHRDRATLVLGQRGMGKTALLLQLAEEARELDYVTARVTAGENMLDEIIETIQVNGSECVGGKRTRVKGFSAGALGFSFGLTFSEEVRENYGFRTKLSLLCDRLHENGKGVLLLVDEVQPDTPDMRSLASVYQHLAGEGKDVAIVMAGLPNSVSRVLNDRVLTFLNRARKYKLDALGMGDIIIYYTDAFERGGRDVSSDQIERAAEATRGFPYLLQLVGYYIMEMAGEGETLTDAGLDAAIAAAQRELETDVFAPTLNILSDRDLDTLRAVAMQSGKSGRHARVADVRIQLGMSNSYFQQYRARLLDAGVLDAPREGVLEIAVPYLTEYLTRSGD